jgi:acetoin utilization protein AcuA
MSGNGSEADPALGDVKCTLELDEGPLRVRVNIKPGFSEGLTLDDGLGRFAHYSSIIQKFEVFEKVVEKDDGRLGLALINDKVLVGYVAGWRPPENDRWSALGDLMYELGAIEVSRNYRGLGLANLLFDSIMDDDFFEDKICYMNGFSWHWDLEGARLTMPEYRRMMVNFIKSNGFKEQYTNEPNVAMREENFFAVRIGSQVSEEDIRKFKNLRFGIKPT